MYSNEKKTHIDRRCFLKSLSGGIAIGLTPALTSFVSGAESAGQNKNIKRRKKTPVITGNRSVKFVLRNAAVNKAEVEHFLDPKATNWAQFDPQVGYTLTNFLAKDGMDHCWTISTYGRHGERRMINYANMPCRINTYGDSFTQCHQVSDAETWQEYLAGHFGEPIRNFGVGGYGVYHAFLTLMRKEATDIGAEYLIFNIWIDDHLRNLDAFRRIRCGGWFKRPENKGMFHANPWDHLRIDMNTGKIVEVKNLCPTPESLYKLCDPNYMYQTFKDDIVVNMYMRRKWGANTDTDLSALKKLAEVMGLKLDFSTSDKIKESVETLYWEYGFKSSEYIFEKLLPYLEQKKKKLFVMLTYPGEDIVREAEGKPRRDQKFIDYLKSKNIPFISAVDKHMEDFKDFKIDIKDYLRRYYIGHYNPKGNHFFAYSVKDDLVKWLDSVPATYKKEGKTIRFKEYLPPESITQ